MKKTFLILGLLVPNAAICALPTVEYVYEYISGVCKNVTLQMPDDLKPYLTSQKFLYGIFDELNKNNINFFNLTPAPTSYASEVSNDTIVSVGFLQDSTKSLLGDSIDCCIGGVLNPETRECSLCGEWVVSSSGKCPSGFYPVAFPTAYMTDVGETCPSGTEAYLTIDDLCTEHIF